MSTPDPDPWAKPANESPSAPAPALPALSQLMILLLKNVLYREDDEVLWSRLLEWQAQVREQAGVLALDLVLDEAEGYAFLKARGGADDDDMPALPRLIARRPLTYAVSLLLALLRKRLAEFDAHGGDTRLVLTRDDLVELLRVFLPDGSNEARLVDGVDATISKVVDLGFLRRLKPATGLGTSAGSGGRAGQDQGSFEVRRILKAFIDAQWLADFDARLEGYRLALADASGGTEGSRRATKAKPGTSATSPGIADV